MQPQKRYQIQAAHKIIQLVKYENFYRLSEEEHLDIFSAFLQSQLDFHHKAEIYFSQNNFAS